MRHSLIARAPRAGGRRASPSPPAAVAATRCRAARVRPRRRRVGDTIVVGSANFTESQILAEIYAQALAGQGRQRVEKLLNIGSREAYFPGLQDGSIDLIPEYTGVLLQYLDKSAHETEPDAVYTALQAALPGNLTVLDKSAAEDKDAVVVTRDTATQYNATSIADLAADCGQLVVRRAAGVPDPPRRHPGPAEDLQLHVQGVPLARRRRPAHRRGAEERRRAGGGPVHHRRRRSRPTTSSCSTTRRTTSRRRTSCR